MIKTRYLILIALLLLSVTLSAKITLGGRAGFGFNFIHEKTRSWESSDNAPIAIFINLPLTRNLEFQPEIVYIDKGDFTLSNHPLAGELENHWHLRYIEVPLMLKFRLVDGNVLSPYLIGGPFIAGLASQKWIIQPRGSLSSYQSWGQLERAAFWDYGAVLGAGLGIKIGSTYRFLIEIRFEQGLANIAHKWNRQLLDVKTQVLSLGFGFMTRRD